MSTKIEKLNKKLKKEKEKDIKCANSDNKELLEKCKYEFDKYQNKDSYYYYSMNELYNYIKEEYRKKISEGILNLYIAYKNHLAFLNQESIEKKKIKKGLEHF
ncbi:TPA: hypothetical protein ACF351_001221 [Clostridium perfringens]|uniref:hypothetical protein n=1 Tax=Clostridium perfringens TaxID=1502 RepID=UPI00224867DF|nr:hypothetical protein [Clostridium perfringens]MCX0398501.1 hypothetical protein [Clostridium perfringens]MDH5099335.1 hypothetical protein [Clostridium perfringens]MDM0956273.1 hypothetical protein [Clostridium perfringens]